MPLTLGLVCHGWHESAAVLVEGGRVVAAAEEERFSRRKFDSRFPRGATDFCLRQAGVRPADVAAVGFGFDPGRRALSKVLHGARHPLSSVALLSSRWGVLRRMGSIESCVRKELGFVGPVHRFNHHLCHAASTFQSSPFDRASVLTVDGVGDWESTWWGSGDALGLRQLGVVDWPSSLGHVYAAFTEFLGFQAFSDEYRVMGLAPYGSPSLMTEMAKVFRPAAGGYQVDLRFFEFPSGRSPRYAAKLVELLGPPVATGVEEPGPHHRNVAASLQAQLEVVYLHLASLAVKAAGSRNLCLAGGVALNCAANGRLLRSGIVDALHVPPCASDAGTALGAALLAQQRCGAGSARTPLRHALLGPSYRDEEIAAVLTKAGLVVERVPDAAVCAARLLARGRVLGWFQGGMEFGQRALGGRSILADPRRADMKDLINSKVKFREPFRPFAPSVLEERASDYFEGVVRSPFMTEVYPVRQDKRSVIPAVTHVDGTARVQTVNRDDLPLYWRLIHEFSAETGIPVVLNTSFNVKGQPIVNTPAEAAQTFLATDLDALVCGPFLATKGRQGGSPPCS